jgi:hypothetical protein
MSAASVVSVKLIVVAVKVPPIVVPPVCVNVNVFTVVAADKVNVPVLLTVKTSSLSSAPMIPVTLTLPEPVTNDRSR